MKGEAAFGYGSYQNMEMCYNKRPTNVAVLNGNVERARTLVRTGCHVGRGVECGQQNVETI